MNPDTHTNNVLPTTSENVDSHATANTADSLDLNSTLDQVRQMAQTCDRDCSKLLTILRGLEEVHREIREDLFQPALPDNRQALYALLRDIEAEGGWPYINRMKLQEFVRRLTEIEGDAAEAATDEKSTLDP